MGKNLATCRAAHMELGSLGSVQAITVYTSLTDLRDWRLGERLQLMTENLEFECINYTCHYVNLHMESNLLLGLKYEITETYPTPAYYFPSTGHHNGDELRGLVLKQRL